MTTADISIKKINKRNQRKSWQFYQACIATRQNSKTNHFIPL